MKKDSKGDIKRTDVNELGEFGLINELMSGFELKQENTVIGVGDDAAVIDIGGL